MRRSRICRRSRPSSRRPRQPRPRPRRPRRRAPAAGGTDIASELVKLKGLMDQGVLTQEEFDQAKQKLLAG